MKTYIIALLFAGVIVSSLCAQDSKPETMPAEAAPSATPVPTTKLDPLSPEPLQLIPDEPTQVPKPSGRSTGPSDAQPLDAQPSMDDAKAKLKRSKAVADADELKQRIRFREVKTEALQDAKVQQQWDNALSARTIPDKKAAMKQFYNTLYARMLSIDHSLKPRIEKSKTDAISRVDMTAEINLNPAVHPNIDW